MNSEEEQSENVIQKEEKDFRATPERTSFFPATPEVSENLPFEANSKEIKGEPPESADDGQTQNDANIIQTLPIETTEKLAEAQNSVSSMEQASSTANANVKEEPYSMEIDYNISIAKTPRHTSSAESYVPMEGDNENQQENATKVPFEANSTEIKGEPPESADDGQTQNDANIIQTLPIETTEKLAEAQNSVSSMEQASSTANANVKEEPYSMEIDYNISIAKTPRHTSSAESYVPMEGDNENQQENATKVHSDTHSSKSALDEYLDGLVTPILPVIPRLRVKTEFALQKAPQPVSSLNVSNDNEAVNTEMLPPPPPTDFSSNCGSDFVADGIATPRISLTAISRLRVKPEFSVSQTTPEPNGEVSSLPADFLNDLSVAEKEPGEVSPNISESDSEDEPIPDDYFDDLLQDKLKERIEEAHNNDLEVKYSDRLKELEKLRRELKAKERKIRKKQKKSKKKSRKRSRSRSLSPNCKPSDRHFDELPYYERNKRSRMSPLRDELPSSSHAAANLAYSNISRVKPELPANETDYATKASSPMHNVEEIEEILTPKQKRERAIKRAVALQTYLKHMSDENANVFSAFPFVSTIRKLPRSQYYVQQQIYENRSPLHTVNNVSYKFNCHASRFNMEEWGLAALSPNAAKMAKLVGCNAQFIHDKLKTIKIPAKLKKLKKEPNNGTENEEQEELIETESSLFSNAMTQTDDVEEFGLIRKENGYDIGVQATPEAHSIGSQTLETKSTTKDLHGDDEAPIMKLIQDLNENQLMALHAFTELIKEPSTSSNAMEVYKIQMKILDIYKMSQIPSTLGEPPIVNNYTAKTRENPQICIQSVKSADGRQYSVNNPRNKSAAYNKRVVNDNAGSSLNNDAQYSQSRPNTGFSATYFSVADDESMHHSNRLPSSHHRPNIPYRNRSPPTTAKRYGRGASRR